MKITSYCAFFFLSILLVNCSPKKELVYKNVQTETACAQKGGTWYKGKCWSGFEDDGISKADIDATVEKEMKELEDMNVVINKQPYPISFLFPEMDDGMITLITIYQNGAKEGTLLFTFKENELKNKSFSTDAVLFDVNLIKLEDDEESKKELENSVLGRGSLTITSVNADDFQFDIQGVLKNEKDGSKYDLSYTTNETIMGAGTSEFEIKGSEAILNGDLGTITYHQLKNIIDNHPEVKTIVMGEISGSVNDAVNMHTGRILREAGLNTKVLKNSVIASGGVDLFCAGKERIVEKGAKIGIHSWCCVNDLTAKEVPQDHPAHQYQIAYFTLCLGKETGPAFYFRTLEAAPFNGVHWMTDEAIQKWKVATKFMN